MTTEEILVEFILENDIPLLWLHEVGHKYVNYKRVIDDRTKIAYSKDVDLPSCMTDGFREQWNLHCNMKRVQGPVRITEVADFINLKMKLPVRCETLEYVYSSPDGIGYTRDKPKDDG